MTFLAIVSCAGYEKGKSTSKDERIYYSSSGFALIYNDNLYENKVVNKKVNNDQILLLHSALKRNKYEGVFTLETSRGVNAASTASNNIN